MRNLLCLLVGVVIAGLAAPAAAQTTSIPDRLPDAEFRRLFTTLSEPGGIFQMGNTFASNERGFANLVPRLMAGRDTTGAYIGVAPEQNFTYIAALRPRIAFIIDIRRQAIMQHLMYKALFEMATDRADFLSLLLARPRGAALDTATLVENLWSEYASLPSDTARATATMRRIDDRLARIHGIQLDSTDAALLRYVYASFVNFGAGIRDEPGLMDASLGYRLASSWSTNTMSMTVEVRDSVSNAILPAAVLLFGAESNAFGGRLVTDSTGRFQLAPYLVGTAIRLDAWRYGYDTAHVKMVIDRSRALLTIRLARGALCRPLPIDPALPAGAALPDACAYNARAVTANPPPPIVRPLPPIAFSTVNTIASVTATRDAGGVARSFLGTESAFRIVKDMHERNLIIPLVGDFAGPTTIRGIGSYLRAHDTHVSAFYVSNVLTYLYSAGVQTAFFRNAETLPVTPSSLIIDLGSRLCGFTPYVSAGLSGATFSVVGAGCMR